MINNTVRKITRRSQWIAAICVASAFAAASVAGSAAAAPAAGSASMGASLGDTESASAEVAAATQTYLAAYPDVSIETATLAARTETARDNVVDAALRDSDTFGGAWYDVPTGTLHVAVTTPAAASAPALAARVAGLDIQTHIVARTFAELEALSDAVRASDDALGRAAGDHVGISVETNEVVVAVPAAVRASLAANRPVGVRVDADPRVIVEPDFVCTDRVDCDLSIRGGAVLWRNDNPASRVCSVGFTARNAADERFVYTAGHCSNGTDVQWGIGLSTDGRIGPLVAGVNFEELDASFIRVENARYDGQPGGSLFINGGDFRVDVDAVASSLGDLVPGDRVCLAANFQDPDGPNSCGVLGTASDPAVRGMARVDGLDACGGDSGGSWYQKETGLPDRTAYGLHSRSTSGCRVDGGDSWFSPLPTITAAFTPDLTVEVR